MEVRFFRKLSLFIACLSVGLISFGIFSSISEAAYYGWKWKTISFQGDVVLRVNDDSLNSSYGGSVYTDGLALWTNSGADVMISDSPDTSADVYFISVASSVWNSNGWGNGYAWTQPYRDDAVACMTKPIHNIDTLCGTGKLVNYAAIYTNNGNIIASSKRRALVAHELGHVMGLAHTEYLSAKADSLMTAALAGGLVPSSYDVQQLNDRY
ncbi:hypothetical protein [Paenibacillus sp. NPDC057967]|uniref:hypothetical protein n=1 Tax=Paenibacillus sp. NPDC057967 TaxID=3346293 RepID=UPI0036DB73BE